jgi:hypothetical protein
MMKFGKILAGLAVLTVFSMPAFGADPKPSATPNAIIALDQLAQGKITNKKARDKLMEKHGIKMVKNANGVLGYRVGGELGEFRECKKCEQMSGYTGSKQGGQDLEEDKDLGKAKKAGSAN